MHKLTHALLAIRTGFSFVSGPSRYLAGGIPLCCTHCHGGLLRDRGRTLYANGYGVARERGGLLHWFTNKPERLPV